MELQLTHWTTILLSERKLRKLAVLSVALIGDCIEKEKGPSLTKNVLSLRFAKLTKKPPYSKAIGDSKKRSYRTELNHSWIKPNLVLIFLYWTVLYKESRLYIFLANYFSERDIVEQKCRASRESPIGSLCFLRMHHPGTLGAPLCETIHYRVFFKKPVPKL